MNIFGWLFDRLRNRRFAIQNRTGRALMFGAIYKMTLYRNWKRDPSPLIFVMYSGPMQFSRKSGHYTDGININYLDNTEKQWLGRMIYLMRKGNQQMTGATFYRFLKSQRPSVVKKAYRRYHTGMINNPRMVSAGITNFDQLKYPFNDPFIQALNEMIEPSSLATGVQVSHSPTELNDRIIQAQNSTNINQIRTNQPGKTAPWLIQRP